MTEAQLSELSGLYAARRIIQERIDILERGVLARPRGRPPINRETAPENKPISEAKLAALAKARAARQANLQGVKQPTKRGRA